MSYVFARGLGLRTVFVQPAFTNGQFSNRGNNVDLSRVNLHG